MIKEFFNIFKKKKKNKNNSLSLDNAKLLGYSLITIPCEKEIEQYNSESLIHYKRFLFFIKRLFENYNLDQVLVINILIKSIDDCNNFDLEIKDELKSIMKFFLNHIKENKNLDLFTDLKEDLVIQNKDNLIKNCLIELAGSWKCYYRTGINDLFKILK